MVAMVALEYNDFDKAADLFDKYPALLDFKGTDKGLFYENIKSSTLAKTKKTSLLQKFSQVNGSKKSAPKVKTPSATPGNFKHT